MLARFSNEDGNTTMIPFADDLPCGGVLHSLAFQ